MRLLAPHTESVGTSTTVSFAIPLPPSLLFDSTQVRVSNGQGIELPAFVRSLGPWRSIPPTPFLCSAPSQPGQPGLRSVLIQFEYTFPSADTVPITVELNRLRTLHRPAETPVQNTWRQVREGTYAATFNLFEPLVYALLGSRSG